MEPDRAEHRSLGANTGLAELRGHEPTRKAHEDFLRDGQLRIDIFGLREGATIDGARGHPVEDPESLHKAAAALAGGPAA